MQRIEKRVDFGAGTETWDGFRYQDDYININVINTRYCGGDVCIYKLKRIDDSLELLETDVFVFT